METIKLKVKTKRLQDLVSSMKRNNIRNTRTSYSHITGTLLQYPITILEISGNNENISDEFVPTVKENISYLMKYLNLVQINRDYAENEFNTPINFDEMSTADANKHGFKTPCHYYIANSINKYSKII